MNTPDPSTSKLPMCPHAGCAFKCCLFQQGNYILTHPGEWEDAVEAGESVAHLEVLGDFHGGKKIVCKASDTATCDNGYKPADCRVYPLFPDPERSAMALDGFIRGAKCPLPDDSLDGLAGYARRLWEGIVAKRPEVRAWLSKVEMVGYERWTR